MRCRRRNTLLRLCPSPRASADSPLANSSSRARRHRLHLGLEGHALLLDSVRRSPAQRRVQAQHLDRFAHRESPLARLARLAARAALMPPLCRPRSSPPVPSSAPSARATSATSSVAASASGATWSCSAPASRCRRRRVPSRSSRSAVSLPVSASVASRASCLSYVERSLDLPRATSSSC